MADDAARAERTEPATGEVTPDFGTASPSDLALLAKATSGGMRSRDVRPEYVDEPATGEDVDELRRRLLDALWFPDAFDEVSRVRHADAILAALDLPGRERALREEIEELAGELAEERTLHDATNATLAKERAEHERALYDAHERGWNEALRRNSG